MGVVVKIRYLSYLCFEKIVHNNYYFPFNNLLTCMDMHTCKYYYVCFHIYSLTTVKIFIYFNHIIKNLIYKYQHI